MAEAASALATELLRCEGRKKTKGRRWAGPAGGDGPGKWPRWLQVMFLSLFYNSVLFYLFYFLQFVFDLI